MLGVSDWILKSTLWFWLCQIPKDKSEIIRFYFSRVLSLSSSLSSTTTQICGVLSECYLMLVQRSFKGNKTSGRQSPLPIWVQPPHWLPAVLTSFSSPEATGLFPATKELGALCVSQGGNPLCLGTTQSQVFLQKSGAVQHVFFQEFCTMQATMPKPKAPRSPPVFSRPSPSSERQEGQGTFLLFPVALL